MAAGAGGDTFARTGAEEVGHLGPQDLVDLVQPP